MKLIIAGDRAITDIALVEAAIEESGWRDEITEVVSGKAKGVDTLGEQWAEANGVPVKPFPARWDVYGKAAGPIRNGQMAEYGDRLIALPTASSKGTPNMIRQMTAQHKPVYVKKVERPVETKPVEYRGL